MDIMDSRVEWHSRRPRTNHEKEGVETISIVASRWTEKRDCVYRLGRDGYGCGYGVICNFTTLFIIAF